MADIDRIIAAQAKSYAGSSLTSTPEESDEEPTLNETRKQALDSFTEALGQQLDELIARMNRPGAAEATESVLFGASASLNQTYRPGATETAK